MLAVSAAVRPHGALVLVAAAIPLANYALGRWAFGVAWPEALVIAFAAGVFWRNVLRRSDPPLPPRISLPLLLFAGVLVASLMVQMAVDRSRLGSAEFTASLLRHFTREYFASGPGRYLQAAELLLEGLFLFSITARAAAADDRLAPRLAGALVASTALAAAVNLQRLVQSASRFDDFWHVLGQSIVTARFNVHYGDVNAAGSAFALMLLVGAGLAAARGRLSRLWAGPALLIALGLWMSGSRTALLVCPVAAAAVAVAAARAHMRRRGRTVVGLGAVALLCAAVAVVYAPTRGNQKASSIAARVRVEMARTTMRMVARQPLFGIGLGEFYQQSGEFSSPELLVLFPPAQHENAHNNFLQILAETGFVGLAAFLLLVTAALLSAARALSRQTVDALAWGCVAGLVAFLLTCVGGHPLLTREPAYSFWIGLGLVVGHTLHAPRPNQETQRGYRLLPGLAAVVLVGLAASVPFRIASARAHAEFEHLAIGVSPHWETAPDGVRYRSARGEASLFVPGETGYRFKVRSLSRTTERLELRLGNRVADVIEVGPDGWTNIAMPARNDRGDTRFVKLDLRIQGSNEAPVTIWITKVEPLER